MKHMLLMREGACSSSTDIEMSHPIQLKVNAIGNFIFGNRVIRNFVHDMYRRL